VICRRNHGSSNGSHNGRSANYFAYLASGLAGATLTAAAVAAYQLAEKNQQPDAKAFHSKNKEGVKMKKCDQKRVRKEYEQNITRQIEMFRVTNAIPGIICRVQIGKQVVYEKGCGYCNIEQLLSCDPTKAVFRIASISKLITGVVTMKLASEGKLDLDDSIYKYLENFPKKQWTAKRLTSQSDSF